MKAILQEACRGNVRILLTGAPGNLTISWGGKGLLPQLVREWKWRRALHEARALAACTETHSIFRILVRQGLVPLLPDSLWLSVKQLRAGRIPGSAAAPPPGKATPQSVWNLLSIKRWRALREKGHDYRFRSPRSPHAVFDSRSRPAERCKTPAKKRFSVFKNEIPRPTPAWSSFAYPFPRISTSGREAPLADSKSHGESDCHRKVLNNSRMGLQAADWFESLSAACPHRKRNSPASRVVSSRVMP